MNVTHLGGLAADAVESTLLEAAEAAAVHTLGGFRAGLSVDNKWTTGFDPVTDADRNAELAVREVIARRFPDHGIIGEEWDPKETAGRFAWIVDPIDGTRAFISGVPVWGTLIGLLVDGRAVAGLMAQPFTGETWIAVAGKGEYRHGGRITPLRTSTVTDLAKAKMTATSPDLFLGPDHAAPWAAMRGATLQTRFGLDCYGYALVAAGHLELSVEALLKNVDIAPLIPIIEAGGGVVTTWDGGPAEAGGTCVAAANAELHAKALAVIGGARRKLSP